MEMTSQVFKTLHIYLLIIKSYKNAYKSFLKQFWNFIKTTLSLNA